LEICISVRNLVEFLMRSGDLDNRKTASAEDAMQEGSRIHRMLQRREGSDYLAEVVLKYSYETPDYTVQIEVRADGIISGETAEKISREIQDESSLQSEAVISVRQDAGAEEKTGQIVVVDEIKGVYRDVEKIEKPQPVHLAQALCYAFIYAEQNDMPQMFVRMTYCNLETEEIRYFLSTYTREELRTWFRDRMQEYRKWTDYQYEWTKIRQNSIHQMQFPFAYREGQKELITYVYQTISHSRKLYLEAPTGVGKTISAVFPSIKAVGEMLADKIFYLTAKTITRTVAEETFRILREQGLHFKTVVLTAKEKMCFQEETDCNPIACPYAKGHFDRINEAVFDLLTHEVSFTRELIEEYARVHQVCPFEMCLDMSLFSDGIICDYNYVFDPHVYLRRFFSEGMKKDYIFLIDEAHNLLERGRDMYSAKVRKEDFLALRKLVNEQVPGIGKAAERCSRDLLKLKKECETYQILDSIETFMLSLNRLTSVMDKYLEDHREGAVRKELLEYYFMISHFLMIYDRMDENYVMYSEMEQNGTFAVRLLCVNPSVNLQECMKRSRSSILFSATLLPIQYYKQLLGGEEGDYEVYAETDFDPEKLRIMIAGDVTSSYKRRGKGEYKRIASYIKEIIGAKKGNYMVFFPSHSFLKEVYEIYISDFLEEEIEECVIQEDHMDEEARVNFLNRFVQSEWDAEELEKGSIDKSAILGMADLQSVIQMEVEEEQERSLIGFCVMGGIFSEGIDLKRDRLIGVIVVGTGIPQVGSEREIMKSFFDHPGHRGFQYAYQYPGMNKVTQAAGRVIRTAEDIGIVVLLDERFLQDSYQRMFPREWKQYYPVTLQSARQCACEFWDKWGKQEINRSGQ